MASEARADNLYHQREAGWYVVNRATNRAVAGPLSSEEAAEDEKWRRDTKWKVGPDDLIVMAVQGV